MSNFRNLSLKDKIDLLKRAQEAVNVRKAKEQEAFVEDSLPEVMAHPYLLSKEERLDLVRRAAEILDQFRNKDRNPLPEGPFVSPQTNEAPSDRDHSTIKKIREQDDGTLLLRKDISLFLCETSFYLPSYEGQLQDLQHPVLSHLSEGDLHKVQHGKMGIPIETCMGLFHFALTSLGIKPLDPTDDHTALATSTKPQRTAGRIIALYEGMKPRLG